MLTMSKYTVNNVSARERERERERETARERTHFSAGAIKRYIRLTSKRRFSSWGMMRTASHRGKWYILLTNTKRGIFSSHKVVYSPHAPYLCVNSPLEYRLFYRALLQKRPMILRSVLMVATPYIRLTHLTFVSIHVVHTVFLLSLIWGG